MTITRQTSLPPLEDPTSLSERVASLAGILRHGGHVVSSGDAAALRRMDPRSPAAAFFKLVGATLGDALPTAETERVDAETRWAAIVVGLAHLADLHASSAPLGKALADADFSELRFDRLMRADSDRLIDELPALARFLAAKGVAANWTDAARLILSASRRDEEAVRRRIARAYFSALGTTNNV